MGKAPGEQQRWYRVWIAEYRDWQPLEWNDVPPQATALEPVEEGCLSAADAAQLLAGFNRFMLARPGKVWAVAIPVMLRYDGDPQPGSIVHGHRFGSGE